MKKRILSVVLAVALVATGVGTYTYFNRDTSKVYAAEFREGYTIIPTKMDSTGVQIDSEFKFEWEEESQVVTIDELTAGLTISPSIEFSVSDAEKGLLITLGNPLETNKIYVFDYKGITWAYKTEAEFGIIGTFPRTQTTNIPVNSGIEVIFNYEGANLKDFFEIEPAVKGSFENHGKVVAFVSKGLEEKTVYTVTIKAGLPLEGSDKKLKEDVVFTFETEAESSSENGMNGYLAFNSILSEYATTETPNIQWDYYLYDEKADKKVETTVYAYNDVDKFMTDLGAYNNLPYWSYYAWEDMIIDTKELSEVMNFQYDLLENPNYPNYLTLPDRLDPGFYLVDCVWEEVHFQTFIQVTDLSFYYSQNTNGDLFWINDLETKEPVEGAVVTSFDTGATKTSDSDGVVTMFGERDLQAGETRLYHIQKGEKQSVLMSMSTNYWDYGYRTYNTNNYFWQYLKSDRSLYKPDDSVEFFGYLKGRYEDLNIDEVTVEITQGYYYYWEFLPYTVDQLSYVTKDIKVENGFFSGNLDLPNLQQGGYEIVLKFKDERIASTYITVENYIKPSYKLEVEKDKKAIFTEEAIEFTLSSSFYEGTPVSYLDYNYNINGMEYVENSGQTDLTGRAAISFTPEYIPGNQGEQYYYYSAYAELPESGSIYVNEDFRVFFNDINVQAMAQLKDTEGTISVQANDITLERINSGDESMYGDYLADPVKDLSVTGKVYRNEWVETEIGEYYDYINKEVRKQYDYNLVTTEFSDVTLTTDDKGLATYTLDLPKEKSVYYTATLNTNDHKNRPMKYEVYFGEYWSYEPSWGDWYHLESDKLMYDINDPMTITYKNNNEQYMDGSYLFYVGQNGVLDVTKTDSPVFETVFDTSYIPNVEVAGVYFNGSTYIQASNIVPRFNYEKNRINLEITTDKEGYKPGEEITIDIKATILDKDGQLVPVKDGVLNMNLVDEALLALSDQYISPLEELYTYVSSGFYQSYSSHRNESSMYGGYRGGMDGATEETSAVMEMDGMAPTFNVAKEDSLDINYSAAGGVSDASVYVRSEFKDTAYFITMPLKEDGTGTLTFKLPDNVTSWRLTGSALSNELQAGSNTEAVMVSLPFFVNTSISSTYLVGDKPMVGVTAYGSELEALEMLDFSVEVYDENKENLLYSGSITGTAFERGNLPLGSFDKEGKYKVIVKAIRENGTSDGIELTINVVLTYHEQIISDYKDLVVGMSLKSNDEGSTLITFVDKGKGYYLPGLYSLGYSGGKRVDQKYLAAVVQEILATKFGQDIALSDVSLSDYVTPDGGIGILPYAESDVETTVNMLDVIGDDISTQSISMYLQNAWYNDDVTEKGAVLYGLAKLGEPVLYDLNAYAKVNNLENKDKMYLALAYAQFGDLYMAKSIYLELSDGNLEEYDERAYMKTSSKEHENLEMTALAMILTDKIGLEIHDKFFDYVRNTYSKEVCVNAQLLTYMMNRIDQVVQTEGGLVYDYNGKEVIVTLENGWPESIRIPSATLQNLQIKSVTGDLAVITTYPSALKSSIENDTSLKVTRKYYNYQTNEEMTSFKEGDIVKVVLDYDIGSDAIDDGYTLTDFAPSGLKPINNPWQYGFQGGDYSWFRDVEGQKVSFYIYKSSKDWSNYTKDYDITYYARIASLGEFVAEAPIIQGTTIKDSMYIGEREIIVITNR